MGDEIEKYAERHMSPELIDYLRTEVARRAAEGGGPAIVININPPGPPAKPDERPDVLARYAPYLVLATWSMIVLAGIAVVFAMIAGALMTMMISTAVCALAVAAAVRSMRMSKEEARTYARARKG